MNVTHFSTSDMGGGAARAAYRLHQGLRTEGVSSKMFVRKKQSTDDRIYALEPTRNLKSTLRRLWRYACIQFDFAPYRLSKSRYLELFSDDRTRFRGEVTAQLPFANVLHLHWISGFVDIRSFFNWTSAPVVWTLHDMVPFTGGCHYDVQCGRYTEKCGLCPQLGSKTEEDLSRSIWNRKREAYQTAIREGRLHLVAPSEWLARRARESSLLGTANTHVIPNGVDHTTFRPKNPEDRRRMLGIPESHKTILFVAQSTANHRKGFRLLIDALKELSIGNITLISVGSNKPSISGKLPHVHVGRIEDDEKLAELYSMVSVFVIPSRQDNLPNTVLESMACGTPVVGFDAGGIPDMVRPNETGWLAEPGNVRSLRNAIETALSDQTDRERKARQCRKVVEEEYTIERQAEEYKSLYKSILDRI